MAKHKIYLIQKKKIVAYINEHLPETKDLLVKQSTSIVEH
jgi:hypothetical protein